MYAHISDLAVRSTAQGMQDFIDLLPGAFLDHLRDLDKRYGLEAITFLCSLKLDNASIMLKGKTSPQYQFFKDLTNPQNCDFYNEETGLLASYQFQSTQMLMITIGPGVQNQNGQRVHPPSEFDVSRCWFNLGSDTLNVAGAPMLFGIVNCYEDWTSWYGCERTGINGAHPEDRILHARAILGIAKTVAEKDPRMNKDFFLYIKDRLCKYFGRRLPSTAGLMHEMNMAKADATSLFDEIFSIRSFLPTEQTMLPPSPDDFS